MTPRSVCGEDGSLWWWWSGMILMFRNVVLARLLLSFATRRKGRFAKKLRENFDGRLCNCCWLKIHRKFTSPIPENVQCSRNWIIKHPKHVSLVQTHVCVLSFHPRLYNLLVFFFASNFFHVFLPNQTTSTAAEWTQTRLLASMRWTSERHELRTGFGKVDYARTRKIVGILNSVQFLIAIVQWLQTSSLPASFLERKKSQPLRSDLSSLSRSQARRLDKRKRFSFMLKWRKEKNPPSTEQGKNSYCSSCFFRTIFPVRLLNHGCFSSLRVGDSVRG